MVDKAQQIQGQLATLNDMLGAVTPYKLALVRPQDCKPAPKNARFMTEGQLRQLVSNVAQDGNLSSLPFLWQDGKGQFWTLSGHHRLEAAEGAGVEWVLALYTDAKLSKSERVAVQLSHNAIAGQDDPEVLKELYLEIKELDLRLYSGLDDAELEIRADESLDLFSGKSLRLLPVTFLLFDHEVEELDEALERIGRSSAGKRYATSLEAWETFFEALKRFQEAHEIVNASTALMVLAEVALQQAGDE